MLKYTINRSNFKTGRKTVNVDSVKMVELPTDLNDKNLLICYYAANEEDDFQEGQMITIENRLDIGNNNGVSTKSYTFIDEYELLRVNKEKGVFTIMVDRNYNLTLSSLTEMEDENGNKTWYFSFPDGHLFDEPFTGDSEIEDGIRQQDIVLYVEYTYTEDNMIMDGLCEIYCDYVNPNQLSCYYNETNLGNLRESVFSDNSEMATISGLRVYRRTPLFRRTNTIFIYIDSILCSISIPLSLNFATNMYQSNNINDKFVEDERNKSINRIVDMEKDVYHPVVWNSRKENYVTGIDKEADKIVFNLHFRQHRGEDWLVEPDTYWNGCYVDETDNNKVKFIDEIAEYTDVNYFSYGTEDDERSKQSDLLTYLGFENNDVRYQKNKLSRSFIRIMFYDSMNPGNQNLLYYSTIFLDAGNLFGKYIKHIEDTPYRSVVYETDETTEVETINAEESIKDLVGIKVDREPYGDLVTDDMVEDDIEELRLSCQLTVQDKYQSNKSSDGFYLYLWKESEIGVSPSDIYMKVEFNHAGYGRTIPFMMPFWDPNKTTYEDENGNEIAKTKSKGIKTFKEILDDWNEEQGSDMQYGARKYMKYSYIHFKCKYDKLHKQHIYYLDDDFYGDNVADGGVHFTDNVITLNLYEAKMV